MKMIPENDFPGLHEAMILIEHPISEMETPPSAFPALSQSRGSGGNAPGASVREGAPIRKRPRTVFMVYA